MMQDKKKTVALIEPAAGTADQNHQKSILARYAQLHNIKIDHIYGERSPLAGAAGEVDHKQVLNDIKDGGVGLLLVLSDVRHSIPKEVFDACREAGVTVKMVDVQQERGLSQPV
jgi:hypothetical protein